MRKKSQWEDYSFEPSAWLLFLNSTIPASYPYSQDDNLLSLLQFTYSKEGLSDSGEKITLTLWLFTILIRVSCWSERHTAKYFFPRLIIFKQCRARWNDIFVSIQMFFSGCPVLALKRDSRAHKLTLIKRCMLRVASFVPSILNQRCRLTPRRPSWESFRTWMIQYITRSCLCTLIGHAIKTDLGRTPMGIGVRSIFHLFRAHSKAVRINSSLQKKQ